jgi:membrane-associated phospholipid phosphatase
MSAATTPVTADDAAARAPERARTGTAGMWIAVAVLCALAAVSYVWWDAAVVRWTHARGIDRAMKADWWWVRKARVIWPGHFACTIVIALLVATFHRLGAHAALTLLLAGVLSASNSVIKWVAGRQRPNPRTGDASMDFHPFDGGLYRLFVQRNLAFPSGDVALAAATAACLSFLLPRWRPAWWAMCAAVAAQRMAENAHHLSDVLAGTALGIVAFHCARVACRLSSDPPRTAPATPAGPGRPDRVVRTAPLFAMDGSTSQQPKPHLSLVIPCYNEEENVPTLLRRVEDSLKLTGRPFEVVIVDDGSTDSTPRLLADAMKTSPWLRVIRMARNGGQSAAFEAGFEAARGDVIATIDADLQNDPEEIPRLLPMLDEQNVDMITGWRKERQDTNFRRWQSRQANRIRNWISKETVNDSASSLKLYRAHAIKGLRLFNGAHRFFPTLVKMRGYTVYETPVKHSHRFAGTAKYGFRNRALRAFVDLLAVRWMKERYLRYEANEVRPEQ